MYVCQSCGAASLRWMGRCPSCGEWDSLVEEPGSTPESAAAKEIKVVPLALADSLEISRILTGNSEFDRVLGGGMVPGSLVLLGGEPGVGKSTLLLQISDLIAGMGQKVLYISGEESAQQIKLRGDRLGTKSKNLLVSTETSMEGVALLVDQESPALLVVDSIQTMSSPELASAPGSVGQVRDCTMRFLDMAKKRNLSTILIGHITKDGAIAGPKVLEHIVDVVLYFEGDMSQNQKLIRTVKNRFGPSNELGVFEMTSQGLQPVENPSGMFLAERKKHVSGSVVMAAMQGTRPILVELQALVTRTSFSTARRMTAGIDPNRVSLLMAMLEKRTGITLNSCDVYMNVAGGLALSEPALDLALIGAVVSSYRDVPIDDTTVVFGEVGLAGEVRAVSSADTRIREALGMGFKQVILPATNIDALDNKGEKGLKGVGSVLDFLDLAGL
jgi:DNA repair protein RadA/Sms